MRERPILFSAPMVRAILDGRKTQTRRVVKPFPDLVTDDGVPARFTPRDAELGRLGAVITCPHGQPGDRLWVRETWAHVPSTAYRCSTGVQQIDDPTSPGMAAVYAADWERSAPGRWRPSIHMPRWACRLLLEVTAVRAERLQDISDDDARSEGCVGGHGSIPGYGYSATAGEHFAHVWRELYGDDSWTANPWVWVIDFKREVVAHG
ncbi:hypothetical protein ACHZ97_14500 [Lysobacter soli]|uniref:hypothetical protein n=1 Tax=Lysobacter soli TaxID=453783 RepID=UPI0037C6649B